MRKLISVILLGLSISLPIAAVADDHSTLRVVQVQADDVGAYIAQLSKGKSLISEVDSKFTLRAIQATFAGEAAGNVIVVVEYPGSFGEFAMAWDKLMADPAVGAWLGGLSELRRIASDSLYTEFPL